jgi:hypothetical protein
MPRVLVVRVNREPVVETVDDPFQYIKGLLGEAHLQELFLEDGVLFYSDEEAPMKKGVRFNRDIPAPFSGSFHRAYNDFLLTRHKSGEYIDLTDEDIQRYTQWLSLSSNAFKCKRCGRDVSYKGVVFCGAACTARYEAGD